MKLIDNILYLEFAEMVECGVSDQYLRKAKATGTKCWNFIDDPSDKRRVLVEYEALKDTYKEKIAARFGNPYDLVVRQPILAMVQADPEAHEFFFGYTYEKNGIPVRLDPQQIAKCTRYTSWLSLIDKVNHNAGWREVRAALGIKSIPTFYDHACALIALEIANGKSETYTGPRQLPGNFPNSYQRLKEKAAAYTEKGFAFCLPTGLANKTAAKLGKTESGFDAEREREQMAVIRSVASKHMNLDAAQVNNIASALFEAKGWEMISDSRVYQIMQEERATLTPGRRGRKAYSSTVAMQIHRKAPDFPAQYWTLDGWTVELLFQEEGKYHHRLVLVVVLDAFTKYPIGYAIGEQENVELIRMANRNAILHLQELTGEYIRPRQLQSDNYQLKNLTPFFEAVAHLHTPARVGNAKAKIIEPYFNHLNKTYCQKQLNWGGHNIDASKDNQVNREMLQVIRKSIPDRAGVIRQIVDMMNKERASKIDAYRAGLEQMPTGKRLPLEYLGAEWLRAFGQPIGRTNKVTGSGLIKAIGGRDLTYDSFEPLFRKQLHVDWQIWADPIDSSRVLAVSPDDKQQFVLDQVRILPMAVADHAPEDWQYKSKVEAFNKAREAEITQTYADDNEIVGRILSDTPMLDAEAEQVLKIMPTYNGQQKQQIQMAKGLIRQQKREDERAQQVDADAWLAQQAAFHQSNVDINEYL